MKRLNLDRNLIGVIITLAVGALLLVTCPAGFEEMRLILIAGKIRECREQMSEIVRVAT